jgi:hypothetical protein
MADEADRAQERIEEWLTAQLAVRRPAGPVATGHCLSCGVKVEAGRRWCAAECRDDWQAVCHER